MGTGKIGVAHITYNPLSYGGGESMVFRLSYPPTIFSVMFSFWGACKLLGFLEVALDFVETPSLAAIFAP